MTAALLLASALGALAKTADLHVPSFWDAKERLAKPDLSAIPRLRFLTTTDFPPFNYIDGTGKLSGFHVDLVRAICAELVVSEKCQIQALPWGELEAALAAGDGEAIIAGLAITAETRAKFAFSRAYLRFPGRFIMPKGKAASEPIIDKLRGKTVGVLGGSGHERMLRDYFVGVNVVAYEAQDALLADLKSGKIDAAFGDGMRLAFWLAGPEAVDCCRFAGGPYLAPEFLGLGLAIAASPRDAQLVAGFDAALQQISAKGIFAELYLRYFPVSFY